VTPLWRRLLLPLALLAALNVAAYAAYTLPRTIEERSLAARAETLRQEVGREQRLIREERRQDRVLHKNAEAVDTLYRRAGEKASILRVRDEVEALAREIGFRVGGRSYSDEAVKGLPLTRFRFTMPVTGSYAQLVALLDRLERSPHFVTVDKVQLSNSEGSEAAVLQLSLSTYFRSGEEDRRAPAR
jgi:Tfp pilus assembly protein PilO